MCGVRRPLAAALVLALAVAGCGGDDEPEAASTTTTSSSSTSSSTSTTSTTAFEGATTPTSLAADGIRAVALLTSVRVSDDRVVFEFEGDVAPGVDVAYVDSATADGSGDPVAVDGEALLQVRMEPASGVDLSRESARETYTGPSTVEGSGAVVEVVRTGDFEANLTWVVGLDSERPFRVLRLEEPARVTVLLG